MIEDYGADAVRLANEFVRLRNEHGALKREFTPDTATAGTLRFVDREGKPLHAAPQSVAILARVDALLNGRPPEDIPELEREITKAIARERAQALERGG